MRIVKRAFSCNRGQFIIRGFEYKCGKNNRIPVIMSHGFLANQGMMKKYAEALAKEGYVVFTYDFCGGGILSKSGGKFIDMSIDTEKEDLKAVMAFVGQLSYVDMKSLILAGASQGGFVSCLVASECCEAVNKLILLYPALCIPDDAGKGKMLMMKFEPERIEETLKSRPFRFSAEYPKSAINIKIYDEIRKIKVPMLIIHGDADKIVDISYAKKAVKVSANSASKLIILENAGHGFKRKQNKEAIRYITEYLKNADD